MAGGSAQIPRVLFVVGKGGTGRSSVAAALGLCFAARGESTLIVEWTFAEAIAPWFGLPPAGHEARPLTDRLSVMNFSLDETLREYFVDHLGLRLLHDHVIKSVHVDRLVHAAPGIAEILFCGRLFWLTTLAREEAGVCYDRIVVDAPATGHGAPLFAVPAALASFRSTGLLGLETRRLIDMFADETWTGALVVALAEELALEETLELVPRIRENLGRPPVAVVVNRSVDGFVGSESNPGWLTALMRERAADGPALRAIFSDLLSRKRRERALRDDLLGASALGTFPLEDRLFDAVEPTSLGVVQAMARELDHVLPGSP